MTKMTKIAKLAQAFAVPAQKIALLPTITAPGRFATYDNKIIAFEALYLLRHLACDTALINGNVCHKSVDGRACLTITDEYLAVTAISEGEGPVREVYFEHDKEIGVHPFSTISKYGFPVYNCECAAEIVVAEYLEKTCGRSAPYVSEAMKNVALYVQQANPYLRDWENPILTRAAYAIAQVPDGQEEHVRTFFDNFMLAKEKIGPTLKATFGPSKVIV